MNDTLYKFTYLLTYLYFAQGRREISVALAYGMLYLLLYHSWPRNALRGEAHML